MPEAVLKVSTWDDLISLNGSSNRVDVPGVTVNRLLLPLDLETISYGLLQKFKQVWRTASLREALESMSYSTHGTGYKTEFPIINTAKQGKEDYYWNMGTHRRRSRQAIQ